MVHFVFFRTICPRCGTFRDMDNLSHDFVQDLGPVQWDCSGVFVDWLRIRQPNISGRYRPLDQACVIGVDAAGEIEWISPKARFVEGSHSTVCRIRVSPDYAELDFNPSRWNRDNNLFGFDIAQCLAICDEILAAVDQPPLIREGVDCACVTRLDLTLNVACGSAGKRDAYIRFLSRQTMPRLKTFRKYGTVMFSSKSKVIKVYDKAAEVRFRGLEGDREAIADWCDAQGIARVELECKREFLRRNNLRRVSRLNMSRLRDLFLKEVSSLSKEVSGDIDTSSLTYPELSLLLAWQRGYDVKKLVNLRTVYRHRKNIKNKTGFDVCSEPPLRLVPKKRGRIVTEVPLPPEWYVLPKVKL